MDRHPIETMGGVFIYINRKGGTQVEEDKNKPPMTEEQSQIPDSRVQEQIRLEIPDANRTDAPVPERPTGNVIDISGDLIDRIMAQQTARETDISAEAPAPEGGQEWEKPHVPGPTLP